MNPFESLKRLRKAQRLYNQLAGGETTLLTEYFPFVQLAFTPKEIQPPAAPPHVQPAAPPSTPIAPAAPPVRAMQSPQPKSRAVVSYRSRSEADDLRDALDIGFNKLTFEKVPNGSTNQPNIKKLGEK